ncbi:unnamed protein product (macronuclear) [Paramecium tetraurelia]|uniref:RING-type domain-containing protein n=1 Tax=Paramecium tetraurelia TaxID=5888 RepID=A0CDN9_PARTE|nr:uncharacterized protein GSPATT00007118001 [Paramecium tetraurelia]CAK68906.1 unnamed protein product [Paramecium tetraurelia]|eukprot:XP_001436303.1 hypothetical protein (macronuclear) [Paramecium tetraurelia strain d4-2]
MQNQIDQGLLQEHEQNNVEGMENEYVDKHKQPTQIFEMGKEYFKQCHQLLAIYTALKFIAAITLITLRETIYGDEILQKNYHEIFNDAYLVFWMYISCAHSLFAFIYYIQLLMKIDNEVKCTQVVEEIGQMIVIEIPEGYTNQEREAFINDQVQIQNQEMIQRLEIDGQIEESRRISLIATEIKKTLLQNERPLNILGKGCFVLFQFIQLWGLIFYFHKKSTTESNEDLKFYSLYKGYLFSVVFMGIYQYLEIYIITLLVLIFLPILLFYSLYDWIKNYCQKRRERRRIDDSLKESMYSLQETAEGENECAICMNQYEEKDKIAILPCSNKHRFHSTCVRSWLEINSKCPLCRSDVFTLPDEIF